MNSQSFNTWKSQQEELVTNAGYPIKIRTKKQDTTIKIFAIVGVTLTIALILSPFLMRVVASDFVENKTLTIHHIHTVELSEDTKFWIENKSIEAGDWIREELE